MNKQNLNCLLSGLAMLLASGNLQASIIYRAQLTGPAEDPPNASPGTGVATVIYDPVAHTLGVSASFSGLIGNTTAAHVHAPTADPFTGRAGVATPVPTFPGFPAGVTAGTYDFTLFDLTQDSSWNPTYRNANGGNAGAEAAFAQALATGRAYFNVHSSAFPGGEIRGFLSPIPDASSTALLLLAGFGGLIGLSRWSRTPRKSPEAIRTTPAQV